MGQLNNRKLTESQVGIIIQRLNEGESLRKLAREFGVAHSTIGAISRRFTWKYVGRYAELAKEAAKKGTCKRLKVGCVIVQYKRPIIEGYNTSPPGVATCLEGGCLTENGHCIKTVHAEAMAISKAPFSLKGASMYVTHRPCLNCTKLIIAAGISSVFYLEDYRNHPYTDFLFKRSGVKVIKL